MPDPKRVIDFDLYRSEREEEPVIFKIGGEEYHLPPSLPASVAVDTIRMKATLDESDEVPTEAMDEFGASMFGPTIWEALLRKHRITVDEISPLIEQVLAAYTGPKEEGETEETTESSTTPQATSA